MERSFSDWHFGFMQTVQLIHITFSLSMNIAGEKHDNTVTVLCIRFHNTYPKKEDPITPGAELSVDLTLLGV